MISDCCSRGGLFLPKSELYEEFEALRRKCDDEYRSAAGIFGFANGDMKILWSISSFGRPCTQKEICDDWCENKQTINSAAKKLAEAGIIKIVPSPDNFREKLLCFTEKGSTLAKNTVGKLVAAEQNAFNRLAKEEQTEVLRISKKHYELLKEEFEKIKGETKK